MMDTSDRLDAVLDAAREIVAAQLACNEEAKRHPSSRSSAPVIRYITAMARLDAALAALDGTEIHAELALDGHEDEDEDEDEDESPDPFPVHGGLAKPVTAP